VFYLGAIVYLRFDQSRRRRDYLCALGLFVLALLSKTVTATLPAALLVVFWWQRAASASGGTCVRCCRGSRSARLPAFHRLGRADLHRARGADFALTLTERFLLASRAVWFYAGKLVCRRT